MPVVGSPDSGQRHWGLPRGAVSSKPGAEMGEVAPASYIREFASNVAGQLFSGVARLRIRFSRKSTPSSVHTALMTV
jgi:hypothetical protein